MKILNSVAFGALIVASAAASAQTAPAAPAANQAQPGAQAAATPTVGATVYDSAGAVVGTVDQVTPQAVVVNVGSNKVALPPASVGSGPQGLRIALTRAEVEAAAQQAQAGAQQQLQAQLTPGATVRGAGGAVVGTVKSATAEAVTLTTPSGDVQLPISGFTSGPNGPAITLTAAQLDAAIKQAGGGAATSGSAGATATTNPAAASDASAAATTDSTTATDTGTSGDAASASAGSATGTAAGSTTTTTRESTTTRSSRRRTR